MVRTTAPKETTVAPKTAPAGTFDMAALIAAAKSGADIQTLMAEAQRKEAIQKAIEAFGVITVRINRSMPVQTADNGNMSVLGTIISGKGVKTLKATADGNVEVSAEALLGKVLATSPSLQINVNISESFADSLADKQGDLGDVTVEFAVNGLLEFRSVAARFDKNDPDPTRRGKPMFTAPDGTLTDEETESPVKMLRLRATAGQVFGWAKAAPIVTAIADEDDILALATNSQKVQDRNLANWSANITAKRAAERAEAEKAKATSEADGAVALTLLAGIPQ